MLKIAEIVIHPSYDFDSNANDVALLKVFMMFVCCNDPYVAFEDNDNEDNDNEDNEDNDNKDNDNDNKDNNNEDNDNKDNNNEDNNNEDNNNEDNNNEDNDNDNEDNKENDKEDNNNTFPTLIFQFKIAAPSRILIFLAFLCCF